MNERRTRARVHRDADENDGCIQKITHASSHRSRVSPPPPPFARSPRLSHAPTTVFSPSLRPPASSPSPASTSSPSHASSSPVRFLSPNGSPSARAHTLVCSIGENHLCVRDTCTYSKRHMIEECKKAHARAHSNSTEMGLSRAQYASRVLDAVGRTRRAREGNNFRVDSATRAREFSRLDAREIDDRWT